MTEKRLKLIGDTLKVKPSSTAESMLNELITEIRRLKDAEEKAFRCGYSDGVYRLKEVGEAWQQYKERA